MPTDVSPPPADVRIHVLAEGLTVGESSGTPAVDLDDFDVLVTSERNPPRPWVEGSLGDLASAVDGSPVAAVTLVQVLRINENLPVREGLVVESLAYSTLQHGAQFRAWLDARPPRGGRPEEGEPVALERIGDRLEVVLQRPGVHNALNAAMRDALIEALAVVAADPAIVDVHLRGAGPSFCSGGDLDEFGAARDAAAAHVLRVDRSVGRLVHEHATRMTTHLHGSCIGAGIEIGAFASEVLARDDTTIRLPEVAMGLIPGAGGTVSIPRRIGRHRTAHLALTGASIDAATALRWGLIDHIE
jgi:hypothetical protein